MHQSEFNASKRELVHFLRLWLLPAERGIKPSYEQKSFSADAKRGRFRLVASPEGARARGQHQGSHRRPGLRRFDRGKSAELALASSRHDWVHVARGNLRVNGRDLGPGDGASLSSEPPLRIAGVEGGEVLVFDLAYHLSEGPDLVQVPSRRRSNSS